MDETDAKGVDPKGHNYENFDPFGEDFEKEINSVPALPVRRKQRNSEIKPHSYDQISVNSGRPVILTPSGSDEDPLTAVVFDSPMADVVKPKVPPIPAPRFSKIKAKKLQEEKSQIREEKPEPDYQELSQHNDQETEEEVRNGENIYSEISTGEVPPPLPSILDSADEPETVSEPDNNNEPLRLLKSQTIDIRQDVNKLYLDAIKELDRDESLVEYLEQHEKSESKRPFVRSVSKNSYDSVAIPEQKFKIVNGVQVPIAVTLLKDFDPCFDLQEDENLSSEDNDSLKASEETPVQNENIYVALSDSRTGSNANSQCQTTQSTSVPKSVRHYYENVWIPDDVSDFDKPRSESIDGACALPRIRLREMDSQNECLKKSYQMSEQLPADDAYCNKPVERSMSATNLSFITKKFSFTKLSRRLTEQVIPKSSLPTEVTAEDSKMTKNVMKRRSVLLESSCCGTKSHSSPLFVGAKTKRGQMVEKWCVLGNANLRYFSHKDSLAEPKEMILLKDILSLHKRTVVEDDRTFYCFDVAFVKEGSRNKLSIRSFGALSCNACDVWVDKIAQSLSPQLATFSMSEGIKLGWAYLKIMFAGEWNHSWIAVRGTDFIYTTSGDVEELEQVNLKKIKNLTLVKEIKNLNAPDPSGTPVLVVDFIDRSLYIQTRSEKDSLHWQEVIEQIAFNNASCLSDQQVTRDEVPVIVEQCVNFVFRHGCLTEGIYRHSGVKRKIDRLLEEFGKNAWSVALTREEFSEHDVANALKRFMRTLEEPLLTRRSRQMWMAASKLDQEEDKIARYSHLIEGLPDVNRRTLRRLIGHLRTICNQSERNLMSRSNLAAIWGPTLLTVDGQEANDFARTSGEADVCADLILHYRTLFNVTTEEIQREEEIIKKTKSFNQNPNPVKLSGEVMMFVYLDTRSGGDCVSVAITPKMTAFELRKQVIKKATYQGDVSKFVLHEVILGGQLERPIHYTELIYDVTLKWWEWPEEDRRDTYLLLKRNTLLEEAIPAAIPPPSVFGEAYFGDNLKGGKGHFKKYQFSMNNARITRSKETKTSTTSNVSNSGSSLELDSWDIEKIIWYLGTETRRQPPSNLNVTFIEKKGDNLVGKVERSKDKPHFGRTISFTNRDLFIKWLAAMLVAEHQTDILPTETLLNLDDD